MAMQICDHSFPHTNLISFISNSLLNFKYSFLKRLISEGNPSESSPPTIGSGGDQKVDKYVIVFVVCCAYTPSGVGKNKTSPSREENGPQGQYIAPHANRGVPTSTGQVSSALSVLKSI
jgi:hypothetical protein